MAPRHLGPKKTRAGAETLPPVPQAVLATEQICTLGCKSENRDYWSGMEVGQADRSSGEPRSLMHQLAQCGQADFRLWQGTGNLLLICGDAARRSGDALDIDVPHQRPIRVAVEDADDLVHSGATASIFRLPPRSGKARPHIV